MVSIPRLQSGKSSQLMGLTDCDLLASPGFPLALSLPSHLIAKHRAVAALKLAVDGVSSEERFLDSSPSLLIWLATPLVSSFLSIGQTLP